MYLIIFIYYKWEALHLKFMGIGDWGLGIGDWAQSPIPNPQSPQLFVSFIYFFMFKILGIKYLIKIKNNCCLAKISMTYFLDSKKLLMRFFNTIFGIRFL